MSPRELLGQHLMIGLDGYVLTDKEKKFLTENNIGGVTLFARNVQSPKQVAELTREIRSLSSKTASKMPFLIGVDQEGGRVARLREPFTVWPPMSALGKLDSPSTSYNFAVALGEELASVGINLDYAPCLDVFTNPQNTVIGDRAISGDPEIVAKHASALIRGFAHANVIPCGKHFPGHGNTTIDSHEDLPVESADLARLESVEFIPFEKAFESGLDLVMTAHILCPKIDSEWPATLSEIFLKKILREKLGFEGVVMTDDMDMKAMAKHFDRAQLPIRALQAGADMILYCNEPDIPPMALDSMEKALRDGVLKEPDLRQSYARIAKLKSAYLSSTKDLPIPPADWKSSQNHRDLSLALREGREV